MILSTKQLIERDEKSIKHKWEVGLCNSGENCWCRIITVSKEEFEHFKEYVDNIDEMPCIVSDGSINEEIANHIVALHNDNLDKKKNYNDALNYSKAIVDSGVFN